MHVFPIDGPGRLMRRGECYVPITPSNRVIPLAFHFLCQTLAIWPATHSQREN
jgi:hypothetical protein